MAETQHLAAIECTGLSVAFEPRLLAASLRYFERGGVFARMVHEVTGLHVPETLQAERSADPGRGTTILAWRSPSEATLLTTDDALIDSLQSAAAGLQDGCVVDQRGGMQVFRARGSEVANLVARTAGHGAMPAIGESRRTRLADAAVSIVRVDAEECLLIVDRIYAPHMMALIRVSAADLSAPLYD